MRPQAQPLRSERQGTALLPRSHLPLTRVSTYAEARASCVIVKIVLISSTNLNQVSVSLESCYRMDLKGGSEVAVRRRARGLSSRPGLATLSLSPRLPVHLLSREVLRAAYR